MAGPNKHAEILESAVRLFQEKGYHATSMQDIADEVGLQKGSLYHYISGKEQLLYEIVHGTISGYTENLREIASSPGESARARLERAVRAHVEAIAANLGMLTIYLREAHALTDQQRLEVNARSDEYYRLFSGLIAEGVRAGEFRRVDNRMAAFAILGACNWVYRWYRPGGRLRPGEIADRFLEVFLRGLMAGEDPAKDP